MTFVSTHSRLKAAGKVERVVQSVKVVSTHSRLKAAGHCLWLIQHRGAVSTHSRLKAAGFHRASCKLSAEVSTHSRLKAAGSQLYRARCGFGRFNTQPPEGGWAVIRFVPIPLPCFNTQPPEGGWVLSFSQSQTQYVSTHSRLKAAGQRIGLAVLFAIVSTHSRLKAAGPDVGELADLLDCFNTQPPEGGWVIRYCVFTQTPKFQHTAA